jgi:hypothetical protein
MIQIIFKLTQSNLHYYASFCIFIIEVMDIPSSRPPIPKVINHKRLLVLHYIVTRRSWLFFSLDFFLVFLEDQDFRRLPGLLLDLLQQLLRLEIACHRDLVLLPVHLNCFDT